MSERERIARLMALTSEMPMHWARACADVALVEIAAGKEHCALIAGRYCEMARDAILASNAAPPQPQCEYCKGSGIIQTYPWTVTCAKCEGKGTKDAPPHVGPKPTIHDLEILINSEDNRNIEILPDGTVRDLDASHVEPKGEKSFVERWTKVIKEMPFGEPSAAESDVREILATHSASMQLGGKPCEDDYYDADMILKLLREAGWALVPPAAEARMVELARIITTSVHMRDAQGAPAQLAALVIETFGGGK